jgi:hypothetical protein
MSGSEEGLIAPPAPTQNSTVAAWLAVSLLTARTQFRALSGVSQR